MIFTELHSFVATTSFAQSPGNSSGLVIIVLLVVLLVAGSALLRSAAALWDLISEILGSLFGNLFALVLVGAAISFVIVMLTSDVGTAAVGVIPPPTR